MLLSLRGFPHRKDNLKQQNKQRKPIVGEKKGSPCLKIICYTLLAFFKIPAFSWSDQ